MLPGEIVAGRFRIEHLAGAGGMGAVYAATDVHSGARVALKLLHPTISDGATRFLREATLLADVRHPGIVRYVAHGDAGGRRLYLAMEWLQGEELAVRLQQGALSVPEVVALGIRVGEALGAAHARGVVHRDIKPQNLFLVGGEIERCKVLDFGVARLGPTGAGTRSGAVVGTPGYMSPEQARGDRDVDARADVFSLGCVLFECITGSAPFVAHSPLALLAKILHEELPRVRQLRSDVPEELDAVVARAISKDVSHRPANGAAIAAELASVLGRLSGIPSSPRHPTLAPSGPPQDVLGAAERRFLSVVLVAPAVEHDDEAFLARARAATSAHGARLDPLAGGALLATVPLQRSAVDQAAQAARCGLALLGIGLSSAVAIGTGRGDPSSDWPFGEAVERAAAALKLPHGGLLAGVRVDEVTHGLLDARFDVRDGPVGPEIVRERLLPDVARSVLGKPTPFVGRDREIAMLESTWSGAVADGAARAVVVTGPPGSGKSRLITELLRRISAPAKHTVTPAPDVWLLRGDPSAASAPFSALAAALRRALGVGPTCGPSEARDQVPRSASGLATPLAQLAADRLRARVGASLTGDDLALAVDFLAELIGLALPDEDRPALRAARADPLLMGDQMSRAWDTWMAAETSPLVIVVEDLEWCDLPSIRWLDMALRVCRRAMLVIAAGRPEARSRFPALWSERGTAEVRLSPLTRRACKELARSILDDAGSDAVLEDLATRSEGNAMYLEELVRLVASGRATAPAETLLAMLHQRIDRLEVEAKRLLRAASVFGNAFWRAGVIALLGGAGREALVGEWLDELCEREVCAPRAGSRLAGQQEYAFRQPLLRDAAYATLTEEDRRLGHRMAGEWLEANGEPDAAILAHHFEQAGAVERAARSYHRAAALAFEGNDFDATLALTERARASGVIDGEALAALLLLRGEALIWRGDLEDATTCGVEALALAPRHSALWYKAAGGTMLLAANVGRYDTIVGVLDAMRAGLHEPPVGPRVMAWALAAWLLAMLGVREMLAPFSERLDRAHASISGSDLVAGGWACLGRFFVSMIAEGEPAAAAERAREAMAWFDAAGDVRNGTNARIHLGWALLALGDLEAAERLLRESIATAERRHMPHLVPFARRFLGPALARQGRLDEGKDELDAAVSAFAASGNRYLESSARVQLALVLVTGGDAAGAEAIVRSALPSLAATAPALALAHAVLARTLLAQGIADEAIEAAEEAMRTYRSLGLTGEHETFVRLAHAGALRAAGRSGEWDKHVVEAARRVTQRADRIRDPAMRERFLAVPENRQTLEMLAAIARAQQA